MKAIIIPLLICLSLRLLFFIAVKPWEPAVTESVILTDDAPGYHELAKTIIYHHQYAYENNGTPDGLRPPLYPLFIGSLYGFFGPSPWVVLLVQTILDSLTCLMLFSILRKLINEKIAFYSALFYAFDPYLIFFSNHLLTETLFIFLCVAAFNFFGKAILKRFAEGSLKNIGFAAFFFGLACLVRPVLIYLPFFIALVFAINFRKQKLRSIISSAVFIGVFFVTLSPWYVRNYYVFHTISFSTSGAYNLLILDVTPMEMEKRNEPNCMNVQAALKMEVDSMIVQKALKPSELNEFQKSTFYGQLAYKYISQGPGSFGKHFLLGVLRSFSSLETYRVVDWLQLRKTIYIVNFPKLSNLWESFILQSKLKTIPELLIGTYMLFFQFLSYICVIIGLYSISKNRDRYLPAYLLIMVLYFIFTAGTVGQARFRLPAIPFYLCFVGAGFAWMLEKFPHKKESGNGDWCART
jgi:4-amino-4-deoxy-L-arabinose transferase-like glycosyltransferase